MKKGGQKPPFFVIARHEAIQDPLRVIARYEAIQDSLRVIARHEAIQGKDWKRMLNLYQQENLA